MEYVASVHSSCSGGICCWSSQLREFHVQVEYVAGVHIAKGVPCSGGICAGVHIAREFHVLREFHVQVEYVAGVL